MSRPLSSLPKPQWRRDLDSLESVSGIFNFGATVSRRNFDHACARYPLQRVMPLLQRWQRNDDVLCRRLWPWVALAAQSWTFEREHLSRLGEQLKPSEVRDALRRVAVNAKQIADDLAQLEAITVNPAKAKEIKAGHIRYLLTLIFANLDILSQDDGKFQEDFSEDEVAVAQLGQIDFVEKIITLSALAGKASSVAADSFLKGAKSGDDPALPALVSRLGKVWTALTNRPPSASKVTRKPSASNDAGSVPDFVLFVQSLAIIAGLEPPTIKEIDTALKSVRSGHSR